MEAIFFDILLFKLFLFIVIYRRFNILVISRLGFLGVHQKAVYFNISFKFPDLILWYMSLMNNGQIERGNENLTQHLP